MAGYDKNLDKCLLSLEVGKLKIGVYKYGKSEPKLGMVRTYEDEEGNERFGKAGRLTWEEVQFLSQNMDKILKTMDEAK